MIKQFRIFFIVDLLTVEPKRLCEILYSFYASVRKEDRTEFKIKSFLAIRQGLKRHFQDTRRLDISEMSLFAASVMNGNPAAAIRNFKLKQAENMFSGIRKRLFQQGNKAPKHHAPISQSDLKKLYGYFKYDPFVF